MDATVQPAPSTRTRSRTPRPAASYRAACRNRVLRPPKTQLKGVWRPVPARAVPFMARPPVIKFNWALIAIGKSPLVAYRERKQPKTYKPNGKREVARRLKAG